MIVTNQDTLLQLRLEQERKEKKKQKEKVCEYIIPSITISDPLSSYYPGKCSGQAPRMFLPVESFSCKEVWVRLEQSDFLSWL